MVYFELVDESPDSHGARRGEEDFLNDKSEDWLAFMISIIEVTITQKRKGNGYRPKVDKLYQFSVESS